MIRWVGKIAKSLTASLRIGLLLLDDVNEMDEAYPTAKEVGDVLPLWPSPDPAIIGILLLHVRTVRIKGLVCACSVGVKVTARPELEPSCSEIIGWFSAPPLSPLFLLATTMACVLLDIGKPCWNHPPTTPHHPTNALSAPPIPSTKASATPLTLGSPSIAFNNFSLTSTNSFAYNIIISGTGVSVECGRRRRRREER